MAARRCEAHKLAIPIEKNTMEARQAENSGRMPIVLGLSILFIIVAFAAVYAFTTIFGAHP